MPDLITEYFLEQASLKGLSQVSTVSRENELRCVLAHCPVPIEEITTSDILDTVARVRAAGYCHVPVNSRYALLLCNQYCRAMSVYEMLIRINGITMLW